MKSRLAALCGASLLLALALLGRSFGDEPGGPSGSPSDPLAQARQLRGEYHLAEAILSLQNLLGDPAVDAPTAAKANLLLGQYLQDQGNLQAARAEFTRVAQRYPTQTEQLIRARVHMVELDAAEGSLAAADAGARALLSDPSPQARAWGHLKLAELAFMRDDRVETQEALDAAFAQAVGAPELNNWTRVRQIQLDTMNWELAGVEAGCSAVLADLAQGLATKHQAAWALFWRGFAQSQVQAYANALASYDAAIAMADVAYPEIVYRAQMAAGDTFQNMANPHTANLRYRAAYDLAVAVGMSAGDQDLARLGVATTLHDQGLADRAIAWLRAGIEDPSHTSETDKKLSEQIVICAAPHVAEAWLHYLLAPAESADPTQNVVMAEFGSAPSTPTSDAINAPEWRFQSLGKLYVDQRRFPDAVQAYQQATSAATTPFDRTLAFTGLARAQSLLASGERGPEAIAARDAGKQAAIDAEAALLELTTTGPDGQAHQAVEAVVRAYGYLGLKQDAIATALHFETACAQGSAPTNRLAFARYMRVKALSWAGRYEEAIALTVDMQQAFAESQDEAVRTCCSAALKHAAIYHAMLGDRGNAESILDALDNPSSGGRHRASVELFRSAVQRVRPMNGS